MRTLRLDGRQLQPGGRVLVRPGPGLCVGAALQRRDLRVRRLELSLGVLHRGWPVRGLHRTERDALWRLGPALRRLLHAARGRVRQRDDAPHRSDSRHLRLGSMSVHDRRYDVREWLQWWKLCRRCLSRLSDAAAGRLHGVDAPLVFDAWHLRHERLHLHPDGHGLPVRLQRRRLSARPMHRHLVQHATAAVVQRQRAHLLDVTRHLLGRQLHLFVQHADVPLRLQREQWHLQRRPVRDGDVQHAPRGDVHRQRAQRLRRARHLQRRHLLVRAADDDLREWLLWWCLPGRPVSGRDVHHASRSDLRELHHTAHLRQHWRLLGWLVQLHAHRHHVSLRVQRRCLSE